MTDNKGIVYALSNPAFWLPERDTDDELIPIVKIGRTSPPTPTAMKIRMGQLYSVPGVAIPFELAYAKAVDDAVKAESNLHTVFAGNRVNPNREFFRVDVDSVIAALEPYPGEEITLDDGELPEGVTKVDKEASDEYSDSAIFTFDRLGIRPGEILTAKNDNAIKLTVVDSRTVDDGEEKLSLTAATKKLIGGSARFHSLKHWNHNGKRLRQIKREKMGI